MYSERRAAHSAQPCGCDAGAQYTCERHKEEHAATMNKILDEIERDPRSQVRKYTPPSLDESGHSFVIKDSGTRQTFASGMQRDVTEGKTNYLLVRDGPMLERWAIHLTNGAKKYNKRNWMKGAGQAELDRAKESAARHFEQYIRGDVDEDHAAAVFFNINQIEYLKGKV
jgi:hypothetical protein